MRTLRPKPKIRQLIEVKSIPYSNMPYSTVGNWDYGDNLKIEVVDLGNEDMTFLLALHELIECYLCYKRGIKEADVSAFDIMFEKNRMNDYDEPGDDPKSPYKKEHFVAETIERIMASELNVDWAAYNDRIAEICV